MSARTAALVSQSHWTAHHREQRIRGMRMIEKECSRCLVVKSENLFGKLSRAKDGLSGWCKKCKTEYLNEWRKLTGNRELYRARAKERYASVDGREKCILALKRYRLTEKWKKKNAENSKKYRHKNKEKNKARLLVKEAIRVGRIVRGDCYVCGKKKTHAHHDDYSKPLDVVWLCHLHHNNIHGKMLYVNG